MNLSQSVKLPLVWGLTSMLIGMILTCFVAIRVERENNLVAQNNLLKEAERLAHETLKRIGLYEYGLRGARGFILGTANQLSREKFNQYSLTRDYEREFPGARGFGFIKRVPLSQEKIFLEQARADGEPDFAIRQFAPHQNERYVIQYIEPQKPNQPAIGLDIGSENFRRTAAETAILTGQVQITAPITLVQANQNLHQSFLMLLAVYSSWTIPNENERWQQTIGWVFTPLSMQDILDTLNVDDNFYQLKLSDVSNLQEPVDFYNSEKNNSSSSLYSHRVTKVVYGRTWQFDITAKPQLLSALSPIKNSDVYTFGVLISFLFGFLAAILGSNRQAKQKITAQQYALAAIVESTHDGIIGKTLDGIITSWNKGAEEIFGYSTKEVIGRKLIELIVPENLYQEEHNILFKIKNGEEIKQFVTTRVTKSGKIIDVLVNVSPVFNKEGKVISASKTVRDITEIKTAERKIIELNHTLETRVNERTRELENILSAATEVSIIATDSQGKISLFNRGAERMLGYKANEIVGKSTPAIIHLTEEIIVRGKELSQEYGFTIEGFDVFTHKAKSGQPETRRWTYINKNGLPIQVSLTVTGMFDETDKLIGFLGIAVDITDQDKLENELRAEKTNADAANTAKSQFLANMSHEIRTPMNAVLGMLQLVQQTPLTENQQDYIDKAKSAAKSLLGILNDILDFSKIEAGKLLLDPHPFSIEEMLEDLAVIMSANHNNKNVELLFDLPSDLPKEIIADRLRLQQILVNLTSNALKFTEKGYVKVSIERRMQTATHVSITISVIDTGIGISHENQQKIFAGFTQAEASTTRRFGGTGLGLAICKRLTDMMGSTLFMKSEPGKGSHFWFDLTLPITNLKAKNNSAKSEKTLDIISSLPLKNMAILVVEDNEVNRQVACELLTHAGAKVDLAEGGTEGVTKVIQQLERHSTLYDLVIMDIQMPDIDGLEATRRIRADNRFKDLPILAMTANASESDRQACLAAGMNDHTGKPFDLVKLIPLIFQLTHKKSQPIPSDKDKKPQPSILVEDINSLLSRYAGNFDLFKRFQKKFKPDIEKLLATLNTAVMENNPTAATSALHSIKGLSATLGAIALSRYASDMEKTCKQQLMPKPQELEKMAQLLMDSDKEMEKMANPEQELPAEETKSSNLVVEFQLVSKLKQIAKYLKMSNMDAIYMFEQIQDQIPNSTMKTELIKKMNNLEFAAAHSCLYKIIEDL